jgi:hypothetical protein
LCGERSMRQARLVGRSLQQALAAPCLLLLLCLGAASASTRPLPEQIGPYVNTRAHGRRLAAPVAPGDIEIVSTAQQFVEALQNNAVHIELRAHLDLRELGVIDVQSSGTEVPSIIPGGTKSIRVRPLRLGDVPQKNPCKHAREHLDVSGEGTQHAASSADRKF